RGGRRSFAVRAAEQIGISDIARVAPGEGGPRLGQQPGCQSADRNNPNARHPHIDGHCPPRTRLNEANPLLTGKEFVCPTTSISTRNVIWKVPSVAANQRQKTSRQF